MVHNRTIVVVLLRFSPEGLSLGWPTVPWWLQWIGPAAWTLSVGWTALDLQGPAMRKTIPIVLYLGLCSMRERNASA